MTLLGETPRLKGETPRLKDSTVELSDAHSEQEDSDSPGGMKGILARSSQQQNSPAWVLLP